MEEIRRVHFMCIQQDERNVWRFVMSGWALYWHGRLPLQIASHEKSPNGFSRHIRENEEAQGLHSLNYSSMSPGKPLRDFSFGVDHKPFLRSPIDQAPRIKNTATFCLP